MVIKACTRPGLRPPDTNSRPIFATEALYEKKENKMLLEYPLRGSSFSCMENPFRTIHLAPVGEPAGAPVRRKVPSGKGEKIRRIINNPGDLDFAFAKDVLLSEGQSKHCPVPRAELGFWQPAPKSTKNSANPVQNNLSFVAFECARAIASCSEKQKGRKKTKFINNTNIRIFFYGFRNNTWCSLICKMGIEDSKFAYRALNDMKSSTFAGYSPVPKKLRDHSCALGAALDENSREVGEMEESHSRHIKTVKKTQSGKTNFSNGGKQNESAWFDDLLLRKAMYPHQLRVVFLQDERDLPERALERENQLDDSETVKNNPETHGKSWGSTNRSMLSFSNWDWLPSVRYLRRRHKGYGHPDTDHGHPMVCPENDNPNLPPQHDTLAAVENHSSTDDEKRPKSST